MFALVGATADLPSRSKPRATCQGLYTRHISMTLIADMTRCLPVCVPARVNCALFGGKGSSADAVSSDRFLGCKGVVSCSRSPFTGDRARWLGGGSVRDELICLPFFRNTRASSTCVPVPLLVPAWQRPAVVPEGDNNDQATTWKFCFPWREMRLRARGDASCTNVQAGRYKGLRWAARSSV